MILKGKNLNETPQNNTTQHQMPVAWATKPVFWLGLFLKYGAMLQWCWTFLDFSTGLIPEKFLKSHTYWHGVWPKHWNHVVRSHHKCYIRLQVRPHDEKTQWKIEKRSAPLNIFYWYCYSNGKRCACCACFA